MRAPSPTWHQRRDARTTRLRRPQNTSLVWRGYLHPSHPALHVRDDAYAPPDERGTGQKLEVICPTAKSKNFLCEDWTAQISLKRFAKIGFWRTRIACCERKSAGARVQEKDILSLRATRAALYRAAGNPSVTKLTTFIALAAKEPSARSVFAGDWRAYPLASAWQLSIVDCGSPINDARAG